ncbi:hypothetical protein [Actinoplanes sp. NPDC026623]
MTAGASAGVPANVTVDARAVLSVEVVDAAPAPGPHTRTADRRGNRPAG